MDPEDLVFVPLLREVKRASKSAAGCKTLVRITPGSTLTFAVHLTFASPKTAAAAMERLTDWHQYRRSLGYKINRDQCPTSLLLSLPPAVPTLHTADCVALDPFDYIPLECIEFAKQVALTRLHFLPTQRRLVSLFEQFAATYNTLDVTRIAPSTQHEWLKELESGHHLLRALALPVSKTVLPRRPIRIRIKGSVRSLSVFVDGVEVELSDKKKRGIVSLALMRYERWFSLEAFCKLGFARETYDPKKQFDASLNELKRFEPFGWDADEGLRRIRGAIIESEVDRIVLREYLGRA